MGLAQDTEVRKSNRAEPVSKMPRCHTASAIIVSVSGHLFACGVIHGRVTFSVAWIVHGLRRKVSVPLQVTWRLGESGFECRFIDSYCVRESARNFATSSLRKRTLLPLET